MRDADRFWGLPPDGRVAVSDGPLFGEWVQVRVEEFADNAPVTIPELHEAQGQPLVQARLASGDRVALAARDPEGGLRLAFDPDAAVEALTGRAALTPRAPLSARLPFRYRRLPAPVRRVARDLLVRGRRRSRATFPAWPVEPSVEALRTVYLRARQAIDPALEPVPFWPDGKRFALVLTHDVDSAGGLEIARGLERIEAAHGLRSAWYLVGDDWPIDHDRLGEIAAAGHELGLHDAHHDNRGPFIGAEALGARLDRCHELVDRYRMRGYRSPSMLRTDAMYEALGGRFAYDSSMPDTGLLPAPNGCATVFPLRHGGVPVLPLTLPPDGQLLSLGLGTEEIVERWIAKAEWVARAGGIAMILTHPEPGFSAEPALQAAYERFLAWVAARDDAWHALPREVEERVAERDRGLLLSSGR